MSPPFFVPHRLILCVCQTLLLSCITVFPGLTFFFYFETHPLLVTRPLSFTFLLSLIFALIFVYYLVFQTFVLVILTSPGIKCRTVGTYTSWLDRILNRFLNYHKCTDFISTNNKKSGKSGFILFRYLHCTLSYFDNYIGSLHFPLKKVLLVPGMGNSQCPQHYNIHVLSFRYTTMSFVRIHSYYHTYNYLTN